MTARELAVDLVLQIIEEDKLSHQVLMRGLSEHKLSEIDRGLVTKLVHGVLERQLTIDLLLESFVHKPIGRLKPYVRNVLRVAAYQILFEPQIPASAAVNEAVKQMKKGKLQGLSGFVNGVLRSLVRRREQYETTEAYLQAFAQDFTTTERISFLYSMPVWLVAYWRDYYQDADVIGMLEAFLGPQEQAVHMNWSVASAKEITGWLQAEGIAYQAGHYAQHALLLAMHQPVLSLPIWKQGWITKQDESSMLAGEILPLRKGMRVLDLCAAPGGKSLHVADCLKQLGGGSVLSRDLTEKKAESIRTQAARLGLDNLKAEVWDARRLDSSLVEQCDLVLADLPCSGFGVIGRKPDVKSKTTFDDVCELQTIQRDILKTAVAYVKKGGYLCFSTCTITKEENQDNVSYLEQLGLVPADFSGRLPLELARQTEGGGSWLQLLPGKHRTDGFFVALFQKQ